MSSSFDHFQGKAPLEHLKDARSRGLFAAAEIHGAPMSRIEASLVDAAKETSFITLLLSSIFWFAKLPSPLIFSLLIIFFPGWILWKVSKSAFLGWARLERLHRLIEEERYEIEHNRDDEREELTALYATKGFSGNLLTQVVDTLMADDQKLLEVMLEEEFGLTLETYEHPLKQASGSLLGALVSPLLSLCGWYFFDLFGLILVALFSLVASTILSAKIERNDILKAFFWTISSIGLALGTSYFIFMLLDIK